MENPWSSPWATDEDPPKESASAPAPAEPSLAFPPAAKFNIADPSSLWAQDDGLGVWGGSSGRASPRDVPAPEAKQAEDTGDGGFSSSVGLDAADDNHLPSPALEADPWATVASPVAAQGPEKLAFTEESALEQNVMDEPAVAEVPETATATPHASPKPLSPVRTGDTPVDEPSSPVLVSPDASPGRGADAVALTVLKHRDYPSAGPEGARHVSKVQELVDMYDGIAKKSTEPPPEPDPSGAPRRPKPAAADEPDEDAEDWEDFEFGDQKPYDDAPPTESVADPPAPTPTSPKWPPDIAKFHIDEASLSTLFDPPAESATSPEDIPERLDPLDAFTVPERRAWYRLSRQGSPRLHEIGDPDNYTRVAWHKSAVSTETFAIVRRWMQEGTALGGRARAGGVGRSAATFGWEQSSSSDPVDLSFLKKRSTEGRQRSESTAASFPESAVTGLANGKGADARPLSVPNPPKGFNLAPEAPTLKSKPAKPSPLVFASTQESASRESDSDEEWGEMVTSPQLTSTFKTEEAPRADSVVSFGKSASGSSLDSRPAGPRTPTIKPEMQEEAKGKGAHVRIASLSSLEPTTVKVDASSGRTPTTAGKSDVEVLPEEAEAIRGVISRLPDLSYMTR